MKKISQWMFLTILLVTISACSQQAGNYTQVIPADATTVIALDLNSMGNKAGLSDQENQAFQEKMLEAMTNGLKPTSVEYVKKIMKSPSESGISSKDPMYVFLSPAQEDPVIVAKVSDEKKLRSTLDVMTEEGIGDAVAEKDGLNLMSLNDVLIVYDKTTAMIGRASRDFTEDDIVSYMKSNSQNNVHKNRYFQKMQKKKGDILFFTSLGKHSSRVTRQMGVNVPNIDLGDLYFIGDFSFEKGKLLSHLEVDAENEEISKLLEHNAKAVGKIKGSFIGDFPVNPLLFFTINLNGEQFFNAMMENEDFKQAMEAEEGAMIREFIKAFNGDVSFGLLDVVMTDMPKFLAYADIKKDDALDVIYQNKDKFGLKRGSDIVQLSPNEYQFKSGKLSFYFGVKDNRAYVTNDAAIYNGTSGKKTSLQDARYASNIKGKNQYFVIDIEAIIALPVVQMLAGFGGKEYKTYLDIASTFSYMEITSVTPTEAEITLHMTNKDTNILKQFVDMAKQLSGM